MANAFTIDEILDNSEWMIAKFTHSQDYDMNIYEDVKNQYGIQLEKIDNQHLLMKGINGYLDFKFDLITSSGTLTDDGTQLRITGQECNVNSDETTDKWYMCWTQVIYESSWMSVDHYYNVDYAKEYRLDISKTANGNFQFTALTSNVNSNIGFFLWKNRVNSSLTSTCCFCIVNAAFTSINEYAANYSDYLWGEANDKYLEYTANSSSQATELSPKGSKIIYTNESRNYPVLVNMNFNDNTIGIVNFSNRGLGVDHTSAHADFVPNGTFDPQNKTVQIDWNEAIWELYYNGYSYYVGDMYVFRNLYPTKFIPQTNTRGEDYVDGTYEEEGMRHIYTDNQWVTNGGRLRTVENIHMELCDYTYMNNVNSYPTRDLSFRGGFFNTAIDFGADVTNDVELVIDKAGDTPSISKVAVQGAIITNKNDQHVDHYELHVVPGYYTSIHDAGFQHDIDLGHVQATNIHSFGKHTPLTSPLSLYAEDDASSDTHNYTFYKEIPYSQMNSLSDSSDYTFFVKTVYTPESGLAPTFHSLKAYAKSDMTSVDLIEQDFNCEPEYYTISGLRVLNPVKGEIYIVRRGSDVSKVKY